MSTVKSKSKSVTAKVVDLNGNVKTRVVRHVHTVCGGFAGDVTVNRRTRRVTRVRWSRRWFLQAD